MILPGLSLATSALLFICSYWLRSFAQRFPEERGVELAALALFLAGSSELATFVIGVLAL